MRARFFARLASISDFDSLSLRARLELHREADQVLEAARSHPLTSAGDEVLRLAHREARRRILPLLAGQTTRFPAEARATVEDRKIVVSYGSPSGERRPAFPELYSLLEPARPFPFVLCATCPIVFAQLVGRGKPRKYCSERCRARGPWASKRAEWARKRRRKARRKEIKMARRAVRGKHRTEWQGALAKTPFRRKKTPGQLRWLLRLLLGEKPRGMRRTEQTHLFQVARKHRLGAAG
jgi:hypothetical protein